MYKSLHILLMSGVIVGFVLLGESCAPQTAEPPPATVVPTETIIATETVTPSPTPLPPTENPAVPLAIVKEGAYHVDLLEGPFGHAVPSTTPNGLTLYHFENTILRADLPAGTELEVIGQFFDCAVLHVRLPDGATGWVSQYQPNFPFTEQFSRLEVNFECSAIPEGIYRPWTGAFQGRQGFFENSNIDHLIIVNKTEYDMLAVLVDGNDKTTNSVYVRSGEELALALLGERFVFIAMGREWLVNSNRFRDTVGQFKTLDSISKDKDWVNFNPSEGEWVTYTLTILGAESDEDWVSIEEFPAVQVPVPFLYPTAVP